MSCCTTHAPLPIQVMTTGSKLWQQDPSYDNAGLPRIRGTCTGWWKQSFRLRLWSLVWFQVRATSCHHHIFEVGLKVNTKVYPDVLKSVVIPWCNQVDGGRPWVWQQDFGAGPQVQRDPGLASEGVLWLCTLLSLPLLPRPEPAGLLSLVIRREHHQHDLSQYQSQPDRRHPPSIRRGPAGACGKSMFPVPDPYRAGDWGWRRLHWIDVSSTT